MPRSSYRRDDERQQFQAWYFDQALPLWSRLTTDRKHFGFFEGLHPDGVPFEADRRARVIGRQIYSYATALSMGWDGPGEELVHHELSALKTRFLRTDSCVNSVVRVDGTVARADFDLYDHAFVLFGLAAAAGAGFAPDELEATALSILARVHAGWKHPQIGFEESIPRSLPLRANPHMHMLEAALAWEAISARPEWRAMADEIVLLCLTRLLDRNDGALDELFDGDWNAPANPASRVLEPGHHFEWGWLLLRWSAARDHEGAYQAGNRLIWIGEHKGVDSDLNLAVQHLDASLTRKPGPIQLWPQTERIKALALSMELAQDAITRDVFAQRLSGAIRAMFQHFEHPVPGSWWEHLAENGTPIPEIARTSSLYHITCALAVVQSTDWALSKASPGTSSARLSCILSGSDKADLSL